MTLSLFPPTPLHPLDSCIQKGGGAWARDWRLVPRIQEEKHQNRILQEKSIQEDRREQRTGGSKGQEVAAAPFPNLAKANSEPLGLQTGQGMGSGDSSLCFPYPQVVCLPAPYPYTPPVSDIPPQPKKLPQTIRQVKGWFHQIPRIPQE